MSRYGNELCENFDKVSVLDIKPSFGDIPVSKQGELIQSNFKDIGDHIQLDKYDCLYLNWSLCYIRYDDVCKVLPYLHSALKSNDFMIMKEPILESNQKAARLCPSG